MKQFNLVILGGFCCVAAAGCLAWAFSSFQPQYDYPVSPEASDVSSTELSRLDSGSSTDDVQKVIANMSATIQTLQENYQTLKEDNSKNAETLKRFEEDRELSVTPPQSLVFTDAAGVVALPLDSFDSEAVRGSVKRIGNAAYFAPASVSSDTLNSLSFTALSDPVFTGVDSAPPLEDEDVLIDLGQTLKNPNEPKWAKIHDEVEGGVLYFSCRRSAPVKGEVNGSSRDGTGFVVKLYGRFFFVTAYHVIDGFNYQEISIRTVKGNEISQFEDFFCFPWIDTAVFEVSRETIEKYPEIVVFEPDKSDELETYEEFITIGNVAGYPGYTLKGAVSAKSKYWDKEAGTAVFPSCRYLELNANIIRGMSGAPLVNRRGKVVGLVKATLDDSIVKYGYSIVVGVGTSYAVPMDDVVAAIGNHVKNDSWVYSDLGVEFGNVLNKTRGVAAVQITKVYPGSPAVAAGLTAGDQIQLFNGKAPQDFREMEYMVAIANPGEVQIDVLRGGETIRKTAVLTYRHAK